MRGQYITACISRCWPLAQTFLMLDIGGINVTILYQLNKDKEVTSVCVYIFKKSRMISGDRMRLMSSNYRSNAC